MITSVVEQEYSSRALIESLPVCRGEPGAPTERVARLKQYILSTKRKLFIEPARLETESYKRTEGEPTIVRRGKAFRDIVHGLTLTIHPDELIVGNRSPLPRMGVVTPSGATNWIDRELESLPTRAQDPFEVDSQDLVELRTGIFPYWRGHALEERAAAAIPAEVQEAVRAKVFQLNQTDHAQGHILPDVEAWLLEGPAGLKLRARESREKLAQAGSLSQSQAEFFEAVETCLDAASDLMQRYADLAQDLARTQPSPARIQELERIANNCRVLASRPPRDFWEASAVGRVPIRPAANRVQCEFLFAWAFRSVYAPLFAPRFASRKTHPLRCSGIARVPLV